MASLFELAVSELNQGINVNHTGRVFLAAMSRSMGFSQEETLAFFSNAPDYNARDQWISNKSNI